MTKPKKLNPLKLLKIFSAESLDEITEAVSAAGVELELTPIPLEQKPAMSELEAIATAAVQEGSKFLKMACVMNGQPMYAFVVLGKKPL